jgi:hypothetical protein
MMALLGDTGSQYPISGLLHPQTFPNPAWKSGCASLAQSCKGRD